MFLYSSLARAEVDVAINLLLFDVRETREDVAVTLSISVIDVSDSLIDVVERSQSLVPLPQHPVLCSRIQMRVGLGVPKLV